MNEQIGEVIMEAVDRLVTNLRPERIILFGSHAWGKPGEDSDIDLYVIVPESSLSPLKRTAAAYRLLRGIRAPIDLLIKTRAEADLLRTVPASLDSEIMEHGRVLYG